ncbi:hypothetical protein [Stenotrophomonas sp. 1337]|uniref:hypothetical protein n=1 Tax=Stenotrophomonas sp. 1337 TaxID=2817757 RepID=UPI002858D4A0|nr:hypothetical protein [Stenotrophomonas sp. 1337]MDR6695477.1 hypothetical protein [Stenotrophomonas sp. 1337]
MFGLQEIYQSSFKGRPENALKSPPDVFAVCGYFAKVSGCYRAYAQPGRFNSKFVKDAESAGKKWRELLDTGRFRIATVPVGIREAWSEVGREIEALSKGLQLSAEFEKCCLYLIVACDAASAGVGLPGNSRGLFEAVSEMGLYSGTLCQFVPVDALRVLPKQHTPRSGFNVRSLTHHLALCSASEVRPVWTQLPTPRKENRSSYNVLVAPWPLVMNASDLKMTASRSVDPARNFGYFDYLPPQAGSKAAAVHWLKKITTKVKSIGQSIDLVVFPECSLSEKDWKEISSAASVEGMAVVAGVRGKSRQPGAFTNSVRFSAPYSWQEPDPQYKHHRWRIDGSQISTYGLGSTLGASLDWWENIEVQPRSLNFFAMSESLVICPLICEDLARQDPVAELVRCVGPNMVVALLMDGPQLAERWSARYASVLADDPGSSVLTITSLGMVKLSKPNGMPVRRVVASWRDAFGQFVPLELGDMDEAIVLNLQFRKKVETTIDGRADGGVASYPVLCGVHSVSTRE